MTAPRQQQLDSEADAKVTLQIIDRMARETDIPAWWIGKILSAPTPEKSPADLPNRGRPPKIPKPSEPETTASCLPVSAPAHIQTLLGKSRNADEAKQLLNFIPSWEKRLELDVMHKWIELCRTPAEIREAHAVAVQHRLADWKDDCENLALARWIQLSKTRAELIEVCQLCFQTTHKESAAAVSKLAGLYQVKKHPLKQEEEAC